METTADRPRQIREANLTWNFAVNLVERTFITLGMSIVSVTTILPLLVSELTPSKIAVGAVPALFTVGSMVPQLLTANYTESLRYKRPFVSRFALVGGRLPYLGIALAVWQLGDTRPGLTLALVFLLITIAALSNGIVIPAWLDMIAKVIPQRLRGTFFGIGNGLGALLGVAGGVIAGRILEALPFPTNFALCFVIASAAMVISWAGVSATREPPTEHPKAPTPLSVYLRQLPRVLRENRNYTRYLISQGLAALGSMGTGFLIVFGRERYGLTGAQVGTMTAMLVGSQAAANLMWGYLGDRIGHKAILAAGAFCVALAVTLTWVSGSVWGMAVAFALLGAGLAASSVSQMNIVLEFGLPQERPTYVGLTNTSLAPITMLAPLLGGWLVETAGYVPTFVAAATFAILGGSLLATWFKDPRRERAAS